VVLKKGKAMSLETRKGKGSPWMLALLQGGGGRCLERVGEVKGGKRGKRRAAVRLVCGQAGGRERSSDDRDKELDEKGKKKGKGGPPTFCFPWSERGKRGKKVGKLQNV